MSQTSSYIQNSHSLELAFTKYCSSSNLSVAKFPLLEIPLSISLTAPWLPVSFHSAIPWLPVYQHWLFFIILRSSPLCLFFSFFCWHSAWVCLCSLSSLDLLLSLTARHILDHPQSPGSSSVSFSFAPVLTLQNASSWSPMGRLTSSITKSLSPLLQFCCLPS